MRDRGRLTGLMTVLVIGQGVIIGSLLSRGSEDETVIPTTLRVVEQASEVEVEEVEEIPVDPGARRRAGRMAALERGLREARETVRELRGRLEDSETASAELRREAAAAAERRGAELASVRAEVERQASIALDDLLGSAAPVALHYPDGRVFDAEGNLIGGVEIEVVHEQRRQLLTAALGKAVQRMVALDVQLVDEVPILPDVVTGSVIEYGTDNSAEDGQVVYSYSFERSETETEDDR